MNTEDNFFEHLWNYFEATEGLVLNDAERREVRQAVSAGDSRVCESFPECELVLQVSDVLCSANSANVRLAGRYYLKQAANRFAILPSVDMVSNGALSRFSGMVDPTDILGRTFASTRPQLV